MLKLLHVVLICLAILIAGVIIAESIALNNSGQTLGLPGIEKVESLFTKLNPQGKIESLSSNSESFNYNLGLDSQNSKKISSSHKIYNPQDDKYISVIGESFDSNTGRWYTYDSNGVRYYNTRL